MSAWNSERAGREKEVRKSTTSCYRCGDRYFPGQCCQNITMMMVEEVSNQEDKLEKIPKVEIKNEGNPTGTLSIQAMEGIFAGNTLKIRGMARHDMLVLLDSGSSH